MNPMGIFGGTFDPIHYAHLRTAFELQQALRLKEIRFLPAGNPPHRDQPIADAQLRLQMVQAGDRRISRASWSTIARCARRVRPIRSKRLSELRHEYPDRSLCLIVGMDAFLSLPKWHQWRELLQLAHLVVAHRPGWRAPGMGPLGELLVDRGTGRIGDLHEQRGRPHLHPRGDAAGDLLDRRAAADRDGPRSALPHAGSSAYTDPRHQLLLQTTDAVVPARKQKPTAKRSRSASPTRRKPAAAKAANAKRAEAARARRRRDSLKSWCSTPWPT